MQRRFRFPFLFAPDDGGGSGPPPSDPPSDPPPEDPPPGDPPAGGKTLTQADVDAMFDREFGKRRAKWEADLKALGERSKLDETERLKAEKADADKAVADARAEALAARIEAGAERAALAAGVKPDRVERFLRLVDLSDVDTLSADGKPDTDAIRTAVDATLSDVPEFAGSASPPPKSAGGDFTGASGGAKRWSREEIAKLSPEEFEKHEAEIMAQMREGGISGG